MAFPRPLPNRYQTNSILLDGLKIKYDIRRLSLEVRSTPHLACMRKGCWAFQCGHSF